MKDQEKLYKEVKKYDKPMMIYISKTDIEKEAGQTLMKEYGATRFEDLNEVIQEKLKER
jgi:GTP1/Obg family GTP-binding protein